MEPEGSDTPEVDAPTAAGNESLRPNFLRSDDAKRNVKAAVWKELSPTGVKPHRSMPQVSLVTRPGATKKNPASHTMHFEQAPPPPAPQYLADGRDTELQDIADSEPDGAASGDALPAQPLDPGPLPPFAAPATHSPDLYADDAFLQPLHPPPGALEFAERAAAAVCAMRLTSERLAEQARSDALELALLVSRRILEAELSTNVERFFGVIRSVIRRAGESRRIVVRLCPEDANRIEAAGGGRAVSAMSVAQVEINADTDLQLGDCMVDADFGVVDGRLNTRLDEMRRLLTEAMAGGDS